MRKAEEISVSAPSLSPSLQGMYNSMDVDNRRVFYKVFIYLWEYIYPKRHFKTFSGVLLSYWCIDALRIGSGLKSNELALLCYLYNLSDGGSKILRSDQIYNSVSFAPYYSVITKKAILTSIHKSGYIERFSRDISAPYLQRSLSRPKIFIRLTYKGVRCLKDMELQLNKLLMLTSYNDLTGANRKA